MLKYILIAAISYILGSLSFSVFASKRIFGRDIREQGSGNAGATNMARVFGWGAGLLTLFCDALKTAVSLYIGSRIAGDAGLCVGGIACFTGHCYPVIHGFKGGKGVSVGAAVAFLIDWRVGAAVLCCFFIGVLISKKVSVGSCLGALSIGIFALIFSVGPAKTVLAFFGAALTLFRHRENIRRIINGTEPNFKAGGK